MLNLPNEPTREVHVPDQETYTKDEVARLIAERAYLLAVLNDMNQRDALAALPPAKYLN